MHQYILCTAKVVSIGFLHSKSVFLGIDAGVRGLIVLKKIVCTLK